MSSLTNFEYEHLPEELQAVSLPFYQLAKKVVESLRPGEQRTYCLQNLLQAKDCAVRAKLHPGG